MIQLRTEDQTTGQLDGLNVTLQHETLTEQVYDALLDALISRQIRPGQRLILRELARRLGVSLTPLRHALARLQAEGIVRGQPRRGLHVVSLSTREMEELFEARLMCEVFATKKAAPIITDAQLQRMVRLAEHCVDIAGQDTPNKRRVLAKAEIGFHRYIVDLAGNQRISDWFRTLGLHLQSDVMLHSVEHRNQLSAREHRAIYEAFAARDATRAIAAVSTHIQAAKAFSLRVMVDLEKDS